jgi:hypothetical protein
MTDVERRPRLAPQTPRVGPASREVEVPRSFSPKRTTMHWVHRVTSRACFHAPAPAFPLRLCSASVTMSSDPSSALLLLRVPSPHALPRSAFTPSSVLSDRAHLPPGFVPLRDFTCTQPLARKAPSLTLWSVLRLSQPLDGLIRTHARGLVSSRCHVQGYARSRTSLSTQPPCLVDRSLPPCRSSMHRSRACARAHDTRTSAPRPLSARRCVRSNLVIHQIRGRFLLRVSLLQVLFPASATGLPSSIRS